MHKIVLSTDDFKPLLYLKGFIVPGPLTGMSVWLSEVYHVDFSTQWSLSWTCGPASRFIGAPRPCLRLSSLLVVVQTGLRQWSAWSGVVWFTACSWHRCPHLSFGSKQKPGTKGSSSSRCGIVAAKVCITTPNWQCFQTTLTSISGWMRASCLDALLHCQ